MLNPVMALFGVFFSFASTFLATYFFSINPLEFFFLPIFLLIFFYTVVTQYQSSQTYSKVALSFAIKKSIGKYLFWLVLLVCLKFIYTHHPFYLSFSPNTTRMLSFFMECYLIIALPYFILIERYRYGSLEKQNDSYLKILSFFSCLFKRKWKTLQYRIFKKGYKNLGLSWLLRLHYIPVMVEQVYWGMQNVVAFLSNDSLATNPISTVAFLTGLLFLIDSNNASIGYFWESNLTKTRFKAMDPYPFHWIIVLMCYSPFIIFAGNFIPFPEGIEGSPLLFEAPLFSLIINSLTIACLSAVVISTSCLGFSYSNLSYKKIQTKGPYRFIRHPGTLFKILFFLLVIFRFKSSFTLPLIAAYLFWAGIYITRAVCEERFLCQFKEYRDYMTVTRYRLIPGIY